MIQRGGEVVIRMMENVQQRTIEPLIKATIALGTMVYTDEYAIYNPLQDWGYAHKTVCHGWLLRSLCQYNRRLLVAFTLLVTTSSWYFSRKVTFVLELL